MATTTKNRCASIGCNKVIKATSTYCPACTDKRDATARAARALKNADLGGTMETLLIYRKVEKRVYATTTTAEWDGEPGSCCIGKIRQHDRSPWSMFDENGGSVRFGGAKEYPYEGQTYIPSAKTEAEAVEVLRLFALYRQGGRKDHSALAAWVAE